MKQKGRETNQELRTIQWGIGSFCQPTTATAWLILLQFDSFCQFHQSFLLIFVVNLLGLCDILFKDTTRVIIHQLIRCLDITNNWSTNLILIRLDLRFELGEISWLNGEVIMIINYKPSVDFLLHISRAFDIIQIGDLPQGIIRNDWKSLIQNPINNQNQNHINSHIHHPLHKSYNQYSIVRLQLQKDNNYDWNFNLKDKKESIWQTNLSSTIP
jgi:hypothetical protein